MTRFVNAERLVEGWTTPPVDPVNPFRQVLDNLWAMHQKKNQDYGRPTDPYANVRGSTEWGIDPWVGAMVRANDKMKRLQKFAQTKELANESVEDSFMDLAVYAIIGLILYREGLGPDAT